MIQLDRSTLGPQQFPLFAANEPNFFFLFVCFGHPQKVLNHLAHENQKGSLA